MTSSEHYDVVILGAGLAGLTLSRHLLRESDKRILVLDKSSEIPTRRQKYGESTVQLGGYYFSKVLDLEEYLCHEHFMKYNLRFYFKTPGLENTRFEDYSQAYIRNYSNIPGYLFDRNRFEADVLRMNQTDSRFTLVAPAEGIRVALAEKDPHVVTYRSGERQVTVKADWVVDATGRGRALARQMEIREPAPINHGSSFMWVEGTVDIEKLTDSVPRQIRLNKHRGATGHIPHWLATNHFLGEGFWFWLIPLRGITSLGLVYDNRMIDGRKLSSAELLRDWVCEEFPLFARDLPQRRILDFNILKSYAHDCAQTISSSQWAMTGESGRFADPLYSPGSDFIALHNTFIVDAILCNDRRKLARKCWLAELMMQSYHNSLVPTFTTTYDALGDQETLVLKYTWDLTSYFTFFVFPFINDLTANGDFIPAHLSRFSRMGVINQAVHAMISGYFQWKKSQEAPSDGPRFHDFTELEPLRRAEKTFYQVGLTVNEGKEVLDRQLADLKELARFIVAYIYSAVLGDDRILRNSSFIESIDFKTLAFDVDQMHAHWECHSVCREEYCWSFDPGALSAFQTKRPPEPVLAVTEKVVT